MKRTPLNKISTKQKLIKIADMLWYFWLKKGYCEVCGKNPAEQVHHFFPKQNYPQLRHILDNGIPICKGCHFRHHHAYDPTIHETIKKKRGNKWYSKLEKLSKTSPSSFKTKEYYKEIIKQLEK